MDQLAAFALTLAVELPFMAAAAASRRFGRAWPLWRALAVGVLASGLTHPVAWWASWRLGPADAAWGFFVIEALVMAAEAVVLRLGLPVPWRHAAALSVASNTASAAVGALVFWGWGLGSHA